MEGRSEKSNVVSAQPSVDAEPFLRFVDREPNPRDEKALSVPLKVLAVSMGVVGLASAFLYLQPSINCAADDHCAEPLSDIVTPLGATILLIACGSLDYAAMNAYFGYDGVLQLNKVLEKQSSKTKKALVTTALMVISTVENTIPLAVSIGAGAPSYVTALSWIGAYPGMFYSAMNIKEKDLPYITNKISTAFKKYQLKRLKGHYTHKEIELLVLIDQQQQFQKRVQANWLTFLNQLNAIDFPEDSNDRLATLIKNNTLVVEPSRAAKAGRAVTQFMSLYLAAHLLGTLYLQVYEISRDRWFDHSEADAVGFTAGIGLLTGYLIPKITMGAFTAIYDNLYNVVTGKPIDWLAFHLHKYKTLLVGAFALATSAISHATLVSTFNHVYDGPGKDELRMGVVASIDLYHLFGIFKLYNLWERKHPKSAREKEAYAYLQEVEKVTDMSFEEFRTFVDRLSFEERDAYRIDLNTATRESSSASINHLAAHDEAVVSQNGSGSKSEFQSVELESSKSDHEEDADIENPPVVEPQLPTSTSSASWWQKGLGGLWTKVSSSPDQSEPAAVRRSSCTIL